MTLPIKHIEKTSLIDYPDHLASILFFGGCSFKCPYCYNDDLVYHSDQLPDIPEDEVLAVLKKRRHLIEGVVFTGGEPTLQKGLADFMRQIRELGLKIKLDTNGYQPEMLEQLLKQGLVDYIAMDVKADPNSYSAVAGVPVIVSRLDQSLAILKGAAVDYEFRTTVWHGYFEQYAFESLLQWIQDAKRYYLHNYLAVKENDRYQSATKAEFESYMPMINRYVKQFGLRGSWD